MLNSLIHYKSLWRIRILYSLEIVLRTLMAVLFDYKVTKMFVFFSFKSIEFSLKFIVYSDFSL